MEPDKSDTRRYTVYDKYLVLIIMVYVFPNYWWLAAWAGAFVLGAIEEFILEMLNRWKARSSRIGG